MQIVQLMTDRSRYVNPSKKYWFSFNAFLISLIGLYFRRLSFRVVLVNTARPDGFFLFVVWFIHWKRMTRPFLLIDKQKRKLSIHQLVVDFWLVNVTKTRQTLRSRMSQHRYDAKDPKYRILYNHFSQPGHDRCLTMKVRIIEKIYHHTNSPILSTPYRTDRELFWIKELGTATLRLQW